MASVLGNASARLLLCLSLLFVLGLILPNKKLPFNKCMSADLNYDCGSLFHIKESMGHLFDNWDG